MSQLCLKCQGDNIITDVRVVDRTLEEDWLPATGDLTIEVETKPKARVFKGVVGVSLKASVCATCGFTELYASDPAKLLEAVEQRDQGNS